MAAMEWLDQLWLGLDPHTQEQPLLFIVSYGSKQVCFSHMQSNHMNLTHAPLLCFFFFKVKKIIKTFILKFNLIGIYQFCSRPFNWQPARLTGL